MKSCTLVALFGMQAVICTAATEGSFDRSLSVSGHVDLDVVTDSGGISIVEGQAGTVRVHAILKGNNGWFSGDVERRIREIERNPPVEQNGNRIRLGYVSDRGLLRNISIRFEIHTPADTEVHAKADSGGIRAEHIHGPVNAHTDSGGIDVRDIASEVRATADSGGIHIRNVQAPVYTRVNSGGIEAFDVEGPIDAEADSGGIHLSQSRAASIRAKADSGGVTLKLAPNAGYGLNLEAESGRIRVPEMTVKGSFSQHRIEGKVRGGGPTVNIRVDSGGIEVD